MSGGKKVRKNLVHILIAGLALMAGLPATSTATDFVNTCLLNSSLASDSCPPHLMFDFGGKVAPKQLPKHKMAPVAVTIRGKVATDNGVQPSALREMTVLLDRSFAANAIGLPTCKRRQLAHSYSAAVRMCRTSIVGTGAAHAEISSQQQGLIDLPLTLFNGGIHGHATTLFILSSIAAPTPTPLLATVTLSKINMGRYGLQVVSKIPRIANGDGSLHDFTLRVKRLFSARCLDGQLNARVERAIFKNETKVPGVAHETILKGTMVRSCTPRD
ncbi:MAG TPA: hypothetical protein VLK89_04770 [Solirubrobacterales bacterium]|nr:hypothetical protein [Solirubrobacterales bacterium]